MNFDKNKILEYLFYILPISFLVGKSYKVIAAMIIIIFLITVVQKSRWEIFRDSIFLILALWCAYLFCSSLWAIAPMSAMKGSLELFLWCLLYLAIKFSLTTISGIEKFIYAQAFVVLFVVLSALMQFSIGFNFFGIPISGSRVTDPFTDTRIFGYIFPIWIGLFGSILAMQEQEKRKYIFYSIVLIGMLGTLPLTGSRGPLIILAVFLPLIAWMSPFRKWAFLALGFLMVALIFVVTSTPVLQARLSTLTNPFEDQKHTRIPIWLVAIEEFKDNPILGVGFRNYRYRQFEYYKDSFESNEINPDTGSMVFHAHSPWLDILAEQGIVGLLFALSLLLMIAKMIYQRGVVVMIGSMGVWYAFSILNSGFVLSSGTWSFFMILPISYFVVIVNYDALRCKTP